MRSPVNRGVAVFSRLARFPRGANVRRLIRCFTCSATGVAVIVGLAAFISRAPDPAVPRTGAIRVWLAAGPLARPSSATWCRPLHVFFRKPGFRPTLQTANAVLLASGFPPRPPASRPRAALLWLSVVSRARTFVAPDPVCGTNGRSTVYSGNWAGHVVPKSAYGNASFTAVQSEWVQPAVQADPNYTDYNRAPAVSVWTGIGVSNLMQAGADSIAAATPRYRFWTEDYPQNMIWEGPPIGPGQIAFVYARNAGNNEAYYFLENVTTGAYSAFTNSLPYIGTDAANYVLERPNGRYLPSFAQLNVWNSYFWQDDTASQLSAVNQRWTMTGNCGAGGAVLAQASDVSGGQFSQAWSHSRPYSNSC